MRQSSSTRRPFRFNYENAMKFPPVGIVATALTVLLLTSSFAADKPNLVLIMADDVGCDAIGCYGGESYLTPQIDSLATGGMRFNHCYSMPSCHPTRVCLLTGRYPRHIANPKWGSFPSALEGQTFAQGLRKAGYATAVAGKWQLSLLSKDLRQPNRMGFDEYCVFGWHEGPRYHEPLIFQNGKPRDDVKDRYGPDVYCEFLIDFMRRNREQPFMAYFPMALCHDVTDDLDEPVPYGKRDRYDSYAEMMAEMDRVVGKLLSALDDLKLTDNTLVVFTGDNGTSMSSIIRAEDGKYIREPVYSIYKGRRVRGGKTKLTDGGTHVPLLVRWPGVIKPKQTSETLVDFSDFLPTFFELAGVNSKNGDLDGRSFAAALAGKSDRGRQWAYSEARGKFWVRSQGWKLYSDGKFFDMSSDASESNPIDVGKMTDKQAAQHRSLALAIKQLKEKRAKP